MMTQIPAVPVEEVLAGYQEDLSNATRRALIAEAQARALTVQLHEALAELDQLRPKDPEDTSEGE